MANSISLCDINAEKRDESHLISSSSFPMLIRGASEFNEASPSMNNNLSNNPSNPSKLATEPSDTIQSLATSSTSISTFQVAEKQPLLHTSGDNHDGDKYSLSTDQSDDSRYHKARDGVCFVSSRLCGDGVFWIKPALDQREHNIFDYMCKDVERFMKATNYKSDNSSRVEPRVGNQCFVSVKNEKQNQLRFYRGIIEQVYFNQKECEVRLLDKGTAQRLHFKNIYEFTRILDVRKTTRNGPRVYIEQPNYLAIRCCISQREERIGSAVKEFFNDLVYPGTCTFKLVEQVMIAGRSCWYTQISANIKDNARLR